MQYLQAILALFIIIDPIGSIPVFLTVTKPFNESERRRALNIATIVAFMILLLFSVSGKFILDDIFKIKIADLRIAGGILLFLIAIKDLQTNSNKLNKTYAKTTSPEETGCVPMACPLLAGPGAITSCLAIWNDPQAGPMVTIVAISAVLIIFRVMMRFVETISHPIGELIITAVSKVMLILLAAIAVNMIVQGITYYTSLSG